MKRRSWSSYRRRSGADRAIHPRGYPNRCVDKLSSLEWKLEEAKDATEAVKLLLDAKRGLTAVKEAVETVNKILSAGRDDMPRIDKCSFCDDEACTDTFGVAACPLHRKAYIDGKLGEGACVSLEDHKLVFDLKKLMGGEYHNEILYENERPKEPLKGKVMS